jgi:hypothetical protein
VQRWPWLGELRDELSAVPGAEVPSTLLVDTQLGAWPARVLAARWASICSPMPLSLPSATAMGGGSSAGDESPEEEE